jgi:hypothetical protein
MERQSSGQGVTKLQAEITTAGCRCRPHRIYCFPVAWKKQSSQNHVSDVRLAMVHQDGLWQNGWSKPVRQG